MQHRGHALIVLWLAASEVLLRNDPSLMTPENVSGVLLLVSNHFWLQGHDLPLLCTEFSSRLRP